METLMGKNVVSENTVKDNQSNLDTIYDYLDDLTLY